MSFVKLEDLLNETKLGINRVVSSGNQVGFAGQVAKGLGYIEHNIHEFEKDTVATRMFLKGFSGNLAQLRTALDSFKHSAEDIERLNSLSFSLFEEIAMFFRERQFFSQQKVKEEQEILQVFEENGNWTPADESLVCKFYYCYLPGFFNGDFSLEEIKQYSRDLKD